MFTGIIENKGVIEKIEKNGSTIRFTISSDLALELHVDQSVAHDGVCLTVVSCFADAYQVDVVQETLSKTNLQKWEVGKEVNLERAMTANKMFDGHIVQGHVDQTLTCISIDDLKGSWKFSFSLDPKNQELLIPQGSICINGVSLTVAELTPEYFSVAIIPYTFAHTNFNLLQIQDQVNIEYDVMGKYIQRFMKLNRS